MDHGPPYLSSVMIWFPAGEIIELYVKVDKGDDIVIYSIKIRDYLSEAII